MLNNGRRTVLLLAAMCVLPMLAAYVVYLGWRPEQGVNHGELLTTDRPPSTQLTDLAGKSFSSNELQGKWLMVTIQPPACDEICQRKLYFMRQVRMAQGENVARIQRLWLLDGPGTPDARLLAEHPGLLVARSQNPAWLSAFPVKGKGFEQIYLVDPLGNLVLRYGDGADPKGMIKDLTRLLKVSQIG